MRRASLKQRIAAKLLVGADVRACWFYGGAHSRKRDGIRRPHVHVDGRMVSVARVICGWANGPAPDADAHAGHTCPDGEVAGCVNPLHLEWQSPRQNLDRRRANRRRKLPAGTSSAPSVDATHGRVGVRAPRGRLTGLRAPSRCPSHASFDAPDNPQLQNRN